MLHKKLRAISENLAVYEDQYIRDRFLQCRHNSCENQHIMEIQVGDGDENTILGGYFCKQHFFEMFRRELARISGGDEIELAGLFGQNVIDVVMEGWEVHALEKLFAEAEAKPIARPGEIVESMVEEEISDVALKQLEEAVEQLDEAAKEDNPVNENADDLDPNVDAA